MALERPERTGRAAEDSVHALLLNAGAVVRRQERLCASIYPGEAITVDFLITNAEAFPHGLAIETKWQETNGSADEKYPYLVENIRHRYPCPALVILGGRNVRPEPGGARPGAVRWLREQVDGERLIGVFTFEEFIAWLRHQRFHRATLFPVGGAW